MVVPPPWLFVLGALAAWRIYKLVSEDTILDRPRNWLTDRSTWAAELLECPYCAGFWVSLLGSLGWYLAEGLDVFGWLVTAFAMSAAVVFLEIAVSFVVAYKDEAED